MVWNHYLIEESKDEIRNAVQKDEEGLPIFDERIGKGVLDGVNTLIYTTSWVTLNVLPSVTIGGMKMFLPLESGTEAIVTLHFGRRSLSMAYQASLPIRSKKPLAVLQDS